MPQKLYIKQHGLPRKTIYEEKKIGEFSGNTYYVSENGNSNDGTDINDPMSLTNAYNKKFKTGDKILFKRGNTFYGQIALNIETVNEELCYIGAYGEGEQPIISGAKIISNISSWEKCDNDIYRVNIIDYKNFDGLKDNREDACNIGFFETENGKVYGNIKKNVELLKNEYDFCSDGKFFYIKSNQNPYSIFGKIILATKVDLLKVSSNCDIENLHIEYTGSHGIVKKENELCNVFIHNNTIEKIGGSYQYGINSERNTRYGNGIEIWNGGENIIIEKNIINNVYDAAITLQGERDEWNNIDIRNNIILNSAYTFELWYSKESTGMKNININNNIALNEGKGWSKSVKYNQQNSADIVLYDFIKNNEISININNNKFVNSERLIYTTNSSQSYFNKGIYLKNNEYYLNNAYEINDNILEGRKINNEFIKQGGVIYLIDNYQSENLLKVVNYDYSILNNNILNILETVKVKNTVQLPLNHNIENYNNYFEVYKNENIKERYNNLVNNLNNIVNQVPNISKETINNIYNKQYELINTIIGEYNTQKINISSEEYKKLIIDLLDISDQYEELFRTYITEDDISNETVQIDINKVIDKYNENSDLEMPICVELINNIKEIYNNNIQNEELSYNYLNKRRIQNTCDIISKLLENEIKINVEKESKSIIVTYNTNLNTLTNKDVTAQIKLPSNKCSIENNPSNTKYTFTENGTKNITINIRGYKYNYDIKITNIDKTLPQITGIEQDGQYNEKVTPQITDENLSEIKLLKDGQTVEDYEVNTSITQEGIYQLIAKDGAGNETTINFIISYPEDEKYIIENNTVKNIKGGTKLSTLKERLQISENYKIKRKNNEVKETENIATGDILETESGSIYTLIVKGDINKDGNVNVRDLVKMRKYILLGNNLDETEKMAADTNVDGKEISVRDLVKLRIMLLISNTNVT